MKFIKNALVSALLIASIPASADEILTNAQVLNINQETASQNKSGIDKKSFDVIVKAKDDFYQYANGSWLKNTQIPKDESNWGSFSEVAALSSNQLHEIVNNLMTEQLPNGSTKQKIVSLYKGFMDEKSVEQQDINSLKNDIERINRIQSKQDLAGIFAHFSKIGANTPIELELIMSDMKNSNVLLAQLTQGALGLGDLDEYLEHDAKAKKDRKLYLTHIRKLLTLANENQAAEQANAILKLETQLAKIQWTNTQNLDVEKTYNVYKFEDLAKVSKKFDWNAYLNETGLKKETNRIQLNQLSYFKRLDPIIENTSLDTWKAYLKLQLIASFTDVLSQKFVNEVQDFQNKKSIEPVELTPRWKRGMDLLNGVFGDGLGELYVQKYFTPEKKQHIEFLVRNIMQAADQQLSEVEWMTPETRAQARKKLSTMVVKVGYPKKWRDYSSLIIKENDVVGNLMRANEDLYLNQLAKLAKPVDRDEWAMTPQTVNAYYDPSTNEIVFPAAILQPPFFDMNADDAVNYGAIGAIIGHEISHAFDDAGSKFDEKGNMKNWWTAEDLKRYKKKTQAMVKQYDLYEVLPKHYVNGKLTLGENIADNLGVSIAYKAYQLSLKGKQAPIVDGFTGSQRFYIGLAQMYHDKSREDDTLDSLNNDVHAPFKIRVNGMVVNQQSFYDAFGIKKGDRMYLAPDKRVNIW